MMNQTSDKSYGQNIDDMLTFINDGDQEACPMEDRLPS